MPDCLVKLYTLPPLEPLTSQLKEMGVTIRPAMPYEKTIVTGWVRDTFNQAWADECDVTFSRQPVSCHIATRNGQVIGFACHEATCRGFFGPTGVCPHHRGRGIGHALLLSCLHAMAASGHAYAIIGGAGPTEFYERTVGAIVIPDSSPGVYRDRLKSNRIESKHA